MSSIKQIIELSPNEYSSRERFVGGEVECKRCHGSGGWFHETGRDELSTEVCPICNGAGYVVSEVVITWKGVEKQK